MRKVLPVLVALILGLAAGWLLPRSQPTVPAPLADTGTPAPTPAAKLTPGDTPVIPAPASRENPEPPPVTIPVPLPQFAAGDGKAECKVSRPDGSPYPGLRFRASPGARGALQAVLERLTLEQRISYMAESVRRQEAASRDAESDAAGAFTFSGLSDDYYTVYCLMPGVSVRGKHGAGYYTVSSGRGVELIASQARQVEFDVQMPDGSTAKGANVMVVGESGVSNFYWRPHQRTFEVAVGSYVAKAVASPAKAEAQLEVPAEGDIAVVVLKLQSGPGLTVIAKYPEPYYERTSLSLFTQDSAARLHEYWSGEVMSRAIAPTHRGTDSYFYENLAPGNYVAVATQLHGPFLARKEIVVVAGSMEVTFTVPPLVESDHIVVKVTDANGKIVADATVSANLHGNDVPGGDSVFTAKFGDGMYWVLKPDMESVKTRFLPPGYEYVVMVHHRTHGRLLQRVPPERGGIVEMQYGGRANVIVEASNLPQEGLGEMWIAVVPFGGSESREVGTARHDLPAGYAMRDGTPTPKRTLAAKNEYRNLQAGPAAVILAREFEGGYSRPILLRVETVLEPGDNVVPVRLPDLHKLIIRPRDGVKLRSLTLFGPGIDTSVRASADGTITVANLPAGAYSLGDTTNGWMTVTLPSAGEVLFDGLPVNSIVIRSYDREGVIYNAGLRKGDVVVSVNGERPEGYEAVRALWQSLRGKPTLDFEVLRDGRTLQATMPGASFPATDANGFNFSYRRN